MPQTQRWTRRLIAAGFGVALVLTLYFGARVAIGAFYWSDPAHRNQAPEGWMTPGYIAHSWGLDPQELSRALNLKPSRAMRSISARQSYRRARLKHLSTQV